MRAEDDLASVPLWIDLAGKVAEHHRRPLKDLADLESFFLSESLSSVSAERPIYICGLARAGSTILLNLLASHPQTASHRYRDFPFPMLPVWWNSFLGRAAVGGEAAVERFHEDRIAVSPQSPEAMEEPLWVMFFRHSHDPTRSNVLGAGTRRRSFARFYRRHMRKLLHLRGGRRYLAKNNYNVSRLGYLHRLCPGARFIVPVRDPVEHIASSMRQHRLFHRKLRGNRRALDYLRRAGHYEFGPLRTPINTGHSERTARIEQLWEEGKEVRGWALYWSSIYGHVADLMEGEASLREAILPVPYADLCGDSRATLRAIYVHVELPVGEQTLQEQAGRLSTPDYYEPPFGREEEGRIREITRDAHRRILRVSEGGS